MTSDEGDGDDWPDVRRRILAAQILVLGTPIWLGHPSSYAQRILERLDAFLGEQDEQGRMTSTDRVAILAVVGNEDGAHHVASQLFQGLSDVGFTIPANGMTYWVGQAMHGVDYKDGIRSAKVDRATELAAKTPPTSHACWRPTVTQRDKDDDEHRTAAGVSAPRPRTGSWEGPVRTPSPQESP